MRIARKLPGNADELTDIGNRHRVCQPQPTLVRVRLVLTKTIPVVVYADIP